MSMSLSLIVFLSLNLVRRNEGFCRILDLILKSTKAFIPADKTSNFYKLDKTQHDKLLMDSITTTYKKTSTDAANIIDSQAKSIAQELNIDNRTEQIAKQQAFYYPKRP